MACFARQYLARIYPENTGYAKREYGVTDAELKGDGKAGRTTKYKGDLQAAIRD